MLSNQALQANLNKRSRSTAATVHRMLACLLILCTLSALCLPTLASEHTGEFYDVDVTAWFAAPVSYAATHGIAYGYNGYFLPYDAVTRGEFAVMLFKVLAAEIHPEELPENPFEDVSDDSFFKDAVVWGYAHGLIAGTSETTFHPYAQIQRQDMALMLLKAQLLPELDELPVKAAEKTFLDEDQISEYAINAVKKLQLQGLIAGDTQGRCNPHNSLSRAEAATVLMLVHCFKTGHTHSFAPAELDAPSCTDPGLQSYRCECGSFYAVREPAPLGHDYAAAKDLASWSTVYTCTRCGSSYSEPLPCEKIYDGNALISYEDALAVVDRLQGIYPDLISSYVGGQSCQGREIRVVTLGRGGRYIFMNGNLHGLETVTTNYLLKVLDEYAYAYATDGSIGAYKIRPLLDTFTIVMLPSCNPDGRAITLSGTEWSGNANGVNLNENFPTNWEYDESGENGSSAGSEPETQTILQVMARYPFELVLDCHTSGNVIYYADSDCSAALTERSYQIASALKAASGFELYTYRASAGLANYARHPYGVPGLTVEMYPYTAASIDCTMFSAWAWSKLSTMPAIVMDFLK